MRTLLAILALVLGCIGCEKKRTATQQVTAPVPEPEPGGRPSFYDPSNDLEYYGRCPKCQRWAKGYRSNVTYADKTGKPVGCEPHVTGTCQYCREFLFAEESGSLTNESRIVTWRPPVSATDELSSTIVLGVTNFSPIGSSAQSTFTESRHTSLIHREP